MHTFESESDIRWCPRAKQFRYVAGTVRDGVKLGGRFASPAAIQPRKQLKALGYRAISSRRFRSPEGRVIEGSPSTIAREAYRSRVPLCQPATMPLAA